MERDGVCIDLISGEVDGAFGPALTHWPISAGLITLEPNRTLEHLLPGGDRAFFYVLSGEVTIAGRRVWAGQIAWSDPVLGASTSMITLPPATGTVPAS